MLPDKYGMHSLRGTQTVSCGSASRLQVVQLTVVAVESHQLVVRASFHDASLVQDTYLVGVLYGGQAVRYSHVVRVFMSFSRASCTRRSLSVSRAEVASSSISMGGFLRMARAMLTLCR